MQQHHDVVVGAGNSDQGSVLAGYAVADACCSENRQGEVLKINVWKAEQLKAKWAPMGFQTSSAVIHQLPGTKRDKLGMFISILLH